MSTNSNISLSKILIFATLSSTTGSFNHGIELFSMPQNQAKFKKSRDYIENWKDDAFNTPVDYHFYNDPIQKSKIIVSFAQKVLENSKDIDSEFIDIVNDNFWDLI